MKIAGIITSAMHGINKRGNGYCRFTIQDYNGSVELYLGQDAYQKYKGFIEEGQVVYIAGAFKNRYQSDDLFFDPLLVRLLSTVSDEMTNSITLKLPLSKISPELVETLETTCANHQGQHHLRVVIYDQQNDISLNFISKGKQIQVDSFFVKELEKLGVPYKLN